VSLGAEASPGVRDAAAAAWRFRFLVERDAEARFSSLARRLEELEAPAPIVDLARRAGRDERRHAQHCARIAAALGGPVPVADPPPPAPVAPAWLGEEDQVTYELVAACCVAETVSVAVLTALLAAARDPGLRAVLHELAIDEVSHARLGWAHLATAREPGRTAFLAPLLPAMLAGSADEDLFLPVTPEREDEALVALGVLPHATRRELFLGTIDEVVLPGLERAGVDVAEARGWLAARRALR
jgi:hypothetical protein